MPVNHVEQEKETRSVFWQELAFLEGHFVNGHPLPQSSIRPMLCVGNIPFLEFSRRRFGRGEGCAICVAESILKFLFPRRDQDDSQ